MSEETKKDQEGQTPQDVQARDPSRRDVLKAMASVPVLGVFFAGWYQKKLEAEAKRDAIMSELGISEGAPAVIENAISRPPGDRIRLGIIGNGGEGESLVRSAGYAHPEWVANQQANAAENPRHRAWASFMQQDDLNVDLTAVCDVFDVRAQRGLVPRPRSPRPRHGGSCVIPTCWKVTRWMRFSSPLPITGMPRCASMRRPQENTSTSKRP